MMSERRRTSETAGTESYNVTIGSREAREAGLLNPDGTSRPVRKTVDVENHRIIIELDTTQEEA